MGGQKAAKEILPREIPFDQSTKKLKPKWVDPFLNDPLADLVPKKRETWRKTAQQIAALRIARKADIHYTH